MAQLTWDPVEGFEDCLSVFAIYDHPLDYPDKFVVRRWFVVDDALWPGGRPDVVPRLFDTLLQARQCIPLGMVLRLPDSNDDPNLCEAWI